MTYYCW